MNPTYDVLKSVVAKVACKPGWQFEVMPAEEGTALILAINIPVQNSRTYPERGLQRVINIFPVPEATYNERSWRRWIFECCRKVEDHELGEWFRVGFERPFAPLHGPGEDPYTVHEFRDAIDARTNQDGTVNEQ